MARYAIRFISSSGLAQTVEMEAAQQPTPEQAASFLTAHGLEFSQLIGADIIGEVPPPPAQFAQSNLTPAEKAKVPRALLIGGAACIALVVVLAIIAIAGSGSGSSNASSSDDSTSRVKPSSTYDDWLAAICRPGTYVNGQRGMAANALSSAICTGSQSEFFTIAKYDSAFTFKSDAAQEHAAYAYTTVGGYYWVIFAGTMSSTSSQAAAVLEPLAPLGFTLAQR